MVNDPGNRPTGRDQWQGVPPKRPTPIPGWVIGAGILLIVLIAASGGGGDGNETPAGQAGASVASTPADNPGAAAAVQFKPDAPTDGVKLTKTSKSLLALSLADRRAMFTQALRGAQETCGRVDAAAYRASYEGADMWVVNCSTGDDYLVKFDPDDSVNIMDCDMSKLLGSDTCKEL